MNMNNGEVVQQQSYNEIPAGVQEESIDMSKWEMETEPLIDRIYHTLIGYSENSRGVWERNTDLSQLMNTKGASEFVTVLRSVFNPNMQMSELSPEFIRDTAADIGELFNNKISEFYKDWGVNPSPSNLYSICEMLVKQVEIFLNIAKNAGMRRHRERRGVKTYYNPAMGGGAL